MKKRILKLTALTLILTLAMPFAFISCGEKAADNTVAEEAATEAAIEETTPEPTPEPTTPEPTEPPTTEAPTEPPTDPAGDRPEPNAQGIIPGYRYYLWSPNSKLYLQVEKESKWTGLSQEAFTGKPNQMFVFTPIGEIDDGRGNMLMQYHIWAVGTTNRLLDTEDADGDRDGALLIATPPDSPQGENSQAFTLKTQKAPADVTEPCLSIMSVISKNRKCVDVSGVSVSEGGFIHMWAGGTANNQKWVFQLVADVESGASEAVKPQ